MSSPQHLSPLLQAENLSLRVGVRVLIEALSMTVTPGELWCVLGPNGSGKTTLLHTLAGLRAPDAGAVQLAGRPLAAWDTTEAARLRGLLPQTLHDAFSASALEIVLMGRHPHLSRWGWEGEVDRDMAVAALAAVELASVAERDVVTLSGGERQRVGIAALLAQDPPLLLLDEPVAHLDMRHQVVVLRLLRELVRGANKAVVLSIHDLNLARRFATHALVLGGAPVQGLVDEAMTEVTLAAAFGHPVARREIGDRVVFIAE